jgi:hypothetical protein
LADVPLHDIWQVELPGGGPHRTIADVRSLMGSKNLARLNPVVRGLFGLRRLLGQVFAWDSPLPFPKTKSFSGRIPEGDLSSSLVEPGTREGPFTVLYVHPKEAVSEVRNATVHAFSVLGLEALPKGYRLFWAIYVAPVGRLTPIYMAFIDPFRRLFIYPAILRRLHKEWAAVYGEGIGELRRVPR